MIAPAALDVRRSGPSCDAVTVTHASIVERLADVRARTFAIYAPLDDAAVARTPDPIMSPPIWDLGHIAAYEELWAVCRLSGAPSLHPQLQAAYDAFETPRPERTRIRLLDRPACHDYLARVRERALEQLERADLADDPSPLVRDGFVFDLVAQHEAQHTETVLQTLQLYDDGTYAPVPAGDAATPVAVDHDARVAVAGGTFGVGAPGRGFAYDCERPRHQVVLPPFALDRYPVSNARHLAFMADGGYARSELWSEAGWAWRSEHAVTAPAYWVDAGGEWLVRRFDRLAPVDPAHPVCHVSWFEADAHARWAGARLPTEHEWEAAASGADDGGRYPWGDLPDDVAANLDQRRFGTDPIGAHRAGRAACGAEQMIGDVWEWTSSPLTGYPGFAAFPYREYAEVFFGDAHRVLRGGSWATQGVASRVSFRNWDLPQRRQIFAGFRLAWDVA